MLQNIMPFDPDGHDGKDDISIEHICGQSGPVRLSEFVHSPLAHSVLPVSSTEVQDSPNAPLPALPLPLPLPAASILVGVSSLSLVVLLLVVCLWACVFGFL